MKVTGIDAWHPPAPAAPRDWRGTLGQIVTVVETDTGVRGIGVGGGGPAGVAVVDAVLRPLISGRPLDTVEDIERLWEAQYAATLPFGRKGLAIMAISAVDLALWDALARARERSVYRLLKEAEGTSATASDSPPRVPCYSTGPDLEAAVARGFAAVKLPCGAMTPEETIERIAALRTSVGPHVRVMTDAGARWDLAGSLRAADGLARYDVDWLEEPLPPDDLEGYAELARRSPIPIAGGEHEYTVRGFQELAAHGAHGIWQPDVTWTGGLTQLRAIFALGRAHGIRVVPHRGAEVWALHAIAALSDSPLAESGRPWLSWLNGQPVPHAGAVDVPTGPGFGVDLTPSARVLDTAPDPNHSLRV